MDRYRVVLSDGLNFVQGMLATQLNHLAAIAASLRCRSSAGILIGGLSLTLALLASLLFRLLPNAAVPSISHIGASNVTDTRLHVQADLEFIPIQSNATEPSVEIKNLPGLGGSTPLHGQWDGYAAFVTLPPSGRIDPGQRRPIFTVLEPIGGCTSQSGHLSKTSTNSKRNDCSVAVNGSPFDRGGGCLGQSMSHGRPVCPDCGVWAGIPSIGLSSMVDGLPATKWMIGTGINYTFAESIGVRDLLVGHAPGWLVRNGNVQISSNYSDVVAPRTAAGVTADGAQLIILLVDGCEHCPGFMGGVQGLTVHELAVEMQKLGAAFAINLDGGGSSTMFAKGKGIVNYPVSFDYAPIFHERSVSTVLCIRAE